jgi:hypothetical protein
MKIQETVAVQNEDKVWVGKKHIDLTFDTETGELAFDIPAMFANPIVDLEALQRTLDKLAVHKEKTDAQDQGR